MQSSPSFDHGGRSFSFRRFNTSDKPVLDRLFNWSDPSVNLRLQKTEIEFGKLFKASTHYSGKSLLVCLHPSVHPLQFILPSGEVFLRMAFCHLDFHPFGELLLFRPFNSPFVHSFGKLFLGRPFYSPSIHPFGELFVSHSFLGRPFDSPSVHPFTFCYFHPYTGMASYGLL